MNTVRIAHSPDADDYFLFWALRTGRIPAEGFEFSYVEMDTAELNAAAAREEFDVVAVSAGAYPHIADRYWILSSGASVGRGFGPVVIARQPLCLAELAGKRIGIPGSTTTAARVFRALVPTATAIEIPISPYQLVFDRIADATVDAAVVIHEGQLDYARHGCVLVADLGQWWTDRYALPLPLGINVIHSRVGAEAALKIDAIFSRAISFGIEHQSTAVEELFDGTQRARGKLRTTGELDHYLARYANQDSVRLAPDCRKALEILLGPEVTIKIVSEDLL